MTPDDMTHAARDYATPLTEAEIKATVKSLHERQQRLEAEIGRRRAAFERSLLPLVALVESAGREMDSVLGESRSWIVGKYGDDGLPVFDE